MAIKLLIVDDEEDILSALNRYFALNDFDTVTTSSSTEALKIVEKKTLISLYLTLICRRWMELNC